MSVWMEPGSRSSTASNWLNKAAAAVASSTSRALAATQARRTISLGLAPHIMPCRSMRWTDSRKLWRWSMLRPRFESMPLRPRPLKRKMLPRWLTGLMSKSHFLGLISTLAIQWSVLVSSIFPNLKLKNTHKATLCHKWPMWPVLQRFCADLRPSLSMEWCCHLMADSRATDSN